MSLNKPSYSQLISQAVDDYAAGLRKNLEKLIESYSGVKDYVIQDKQKKIYIFLDETKYVADILSEMEPIEQAIKQKCPSYSVHVENQ